MFYTNRCSPVKWLLNFAEKGVRRSLAARPCAVLLAIAVPLFAGTACVTVEAKVLPPAHAGLTAEEARRFADKEAGKRGDEVGVVLEFKSMRADADPEGRPAWVAIYRDPTGEYLDLCVFLRGHPQDRNRYNVFSGDCPD
jgi:hypothetical protein